MAKSGGSEKLKRAAIPAAAALLLIVLLAAVYPRMTRKDDAAPAAQAQPVPAESEWAGKLRISELMAKNTAAYMDETGAFPDWIELENVSEEAIALTDFTLADGVDEDGWRFPCVTLGAGERMVICADGTDKKEAPLHTDFSLSKGETAVLRDARGLIVDAVECSTGKANMALRLNGAGEWEATYFATPGYENSAAGYDAYQAALTADTPVIISEAVTANFSTLKQKNLGYCDWAEIKNISNESVRLSEYYLSDDAAALDIWAFPDVTLAPGESVIVLCDKRSGAADAGFLHAPFELDSTAEGLYLSDRSGRVRDCAFLHDIPYGGSMGRMSGENGWFYFASPQPGAEKTGGCRRISAAPVCLGRDGVYEGVDSVTAELSAAGKIYYTTDGSLPTENSKVYDGAIELTRTAVIRAVSVEDGALKSPALTLSYIINEGHTLPVASLVADDPDEFGRMYNNKKKNIELPGSISLYAGEEDLFTAPCGIDMHGETSLEMPKKNMGLRFRGAYGLSELDCDIFSGGVTSFTGLILRAGQDQNNTIIRNELLEDLCLEYSDSVPTQRSRYCVLYVNGEYRGIYTLMEKVDKQHYASLMGVSRESVTVMKAWANPGTEYYETVIRFAEDNDLTAPEAYARFCELVDIDNLIDWMIIEGYSANTDLAKSNLRYARSSEGDGKWRYMLYDMDATLTIPANIFRNVLTPSSTQSAEFITQLTNNAEFRDRFLRRAAEVLSTTLSNENVDARIAEMTAQIAPEVARDFALRRMSYAQWEAAVAQLRAAITEKDWRGRCVAAIGQYMHLSDAEMREYFPA